VHAGHQTGRRDLVQWTQSSEDHSAPGTCVGREEGRKAGQPLAFALDALFRLPSADSDAADDDSGDIRRSTPATLSPAIHRGQPLPEKG